MAQSSARCNLRQNLLFDSKDKLAGGTSTKSSNPHTPVSVTTNALTSAITPVVAPLIASGSADSSVVRYSDDNLQRIIKTIFETRPLLSPTLTPVSASVVTAAPYNKGLHKRPLKTWLPSIYQSKTHLEYYNFFQQYKDHFVTAGARGPNRVLFADTLLEDIGLFCWQQHQHKIKAQTNVFITWERFKAFFRQSLGKSEAFVDTIRRTIRKDSQH